MARDPQTLSICDDDGNEHAYVCTPHPGGQGLQLGTKLLTFIGPGIVGIVREVLRQVELNRGPEVFSFRKLFEGKVDTSSLADSIGELIKNLPDAPVLVKELLKHTVRDGKLLSNQAEFDTAYQGNYGELVEAIVFAFGVNRFLGFFSRRSTTA